MEAETAILRLVEARGSGASICPSEAARAMAGEGEDWRRHLKAVRAAAERLVRAGRIDMLRKGRVVEEPESAKGVIRLRLRAGQADT